MNQYTVDGYTRISKARDRHAAWCAQVDAERDRNRHGGEVVPF